MMRMPSGIFIGLAASVAFAVACADSGTDPVDDMNDDDMQQSENVCGDAVCAAAEVGYCQADCGTGGNNNGPQCGNGMCESSMGESNATCSADCPASGGGSGSGSGSATSCPSDPLVCFACIIDVSLCTAPYDQATCQACLGGGGGGGGGFGDDTNCEGGAPDGTCSVAEEADPFTCITDCLQ